MENTFFSVNHGTIFFLRISKYNFFFLRKSEYNFFSKKNPDPPGYEMGGPLWESNRDCVVWQTLGCPVGNVNSQFIINQAVNQFTAKVNMVVSHFKCLHYVIMYTLFKTYCIPLYGCPLWDYSTKCIGKFYVALLKSIRRIFNIPYTTHCALFNEICGDMPVQDQLYIRFINFYRSLLNSKKYVNQSMCKHGFTGQ